MPSDDLLDSLIEKIAEAVVRKIEEREKIDLIAAVLAWLNLLHHFHGNPSCRRVGTTPHENRMASESRTRSGCPATQPQQAGDSIRSGVTLVIFRGIRLASLTHHAIGKIVLVVGRL